MLDVLGGEAKLVVLLASAQRTPDFPQRLLNRVRRQPGAVDGKKRQEVKYLATFLDHKTTIHVGFGRLQLRIEENLAFDCLVGQSDSHVGSILSAAEGLPETVLEH